MPTPASRVVLHVPQRNAFFRLSQWFASTRPVAWLYARTLHYVDNTLLRLSGGRWSVPGLLGGLPTLTLTTIGAKSGQPRSLPLIGIPDGDTIIVIASNWGQQHHPSWYYNLRAHPEATVTVDGQSSAYMAREATDTERVRYWRLAEGVYPGYAAYRRRAGNRTIPIIVLTPTTT